MHVTDNMPTHSHQEIPRVIACAILCTLFFSGAKANAKSLSMEKVIEAEKAAVESRRTIKSGHFVVSVTYNTFLADPSYTKVKFRYDIFIKGTDIRADVGYYQSNKLGSKNSTVFTKNTFIRAPLSDDSVIDLFGPSTRPPKTLETPNPRLLGFVPWNFPTIDQFGYEEYLLRSDRLLLSAELNEYHGEPVIEVSYQFNTNGETSFVEYRLAVNKGYQPIYVATWCGKGDKKAFFSAESTLKYHRSSDLWFPSKVVFRAKMVDLLTQEEIDTVELAEINRDIDDQTFTLAGMGLKPGRLVANDGEYMWWTGNRLVPKMVGQDKYYSVTTDDRSGWRGWMLAANAILLAILSAIFLIRRIFKRRRYTRS